MEDKQAADYFVVAGLPNNPHPLEDFSQDGFILKNTESMVPITDIAVIIRSQGEPIPSGYTCIETTPSSLLADLNHGSLRSPSIFLCYKRSRDKPPLVDIGVLYEGKERVMADSEVVLTTPYGRTANVNNSGSRTFLTYRRASETAVCNQLVVTDICVILANKGENPPHAFCVIYKNLNKGMVGSDVYICYKKSMHKPNRLCFKPGVLGRFPMENYQNFPFPESVALFCLPMGATVECWPKTAQKPLPAFSTFVLTSDSYEKLYGAAVTFYEKFSENKLTQQQKMQLTYVTEADRQKKSLHANKAICLLSRWPFFETFEKFLLFLHKMSVSGPHPVPLERYISHFMLDVPFPSLQRPRILIQLTANDTVSLAQPEDTPLPLSGASFIQLLRNLGADNCLNVLLFALTEQKILFHSLRTDVLTRVAEAAVAMMFPFHWQCPYIPLCPLGLSDVLHAPLPFIVGVDSRYFDLYDPPQDVVCVDLDTNSIFVSEERKGLNPKLLPKRAMRILRNTLQGLYEKIRYTRHSSQTPSKEAQDPLDYDFKIKKKEHQLELEIQEAFLRFIASILKGFRMYLLPITQAPTLGTMDASSLFDYQGFLKSRDKNYNRFYMLLTKTQMFIRFIEERSFVSDKDVSLAFFDECCERIDEAVEMRFLESDDSHQSDRTVFLPPPEPSGGNYTYKEFGMLHMNLFHRHPAQNLLTIPSSSTPPPSSPLARRTKLEIKSAQKVARKQSETPIHWAKCLVRYCYSLWFIHLPSLVKVSPSKSKALKSAFTVLRFMQTLKLYPADEVCYRVLMLLCGLYSQPVLAVKVLFEMKNNGVQPNAITYGYYNKAVLESKWPAADSNGVLMWNKLRNVILGVAQFRQGHRTKTRRSISLCSDNDYDLISQNSGGSTELVKLESDPLKIEDQRSSGGQSDAGYSSLNQEEAKKISSQIADLSEAKGDCKPVSKVVVDFSDSDAFRNKVGSIVKRSASSLGSMNHLHDSKVDSPAGVLMTSQSFLNNDNFEGDSAFDDFSRRRHRSSSDSKPSCRYRMRHCSGPPLNSDNSIPAFCRSNSFGNDEQILHKILPNKVEESETPIKSADINMALSCCEEESEKELALEETLVSMRPRSPNIPIAKREDVPNSLDSSEMGSSKDFLAMTFSPIKDAWQNWDISGSLPKVASSISTKLTNSFGTNTPSRAGSRVTRSSTFHTQGPEKRATFPRLSAQVEDAPEFSKSSTLSRSSTLPLADIQQISSNGPTSRTPTQQPGTSFSGFSRFKPKNTEVLFDSLKSAASSMATRFNGFRQSLSANNTPTKGSNSSLARVLDAERYIKDEEDEVASNTSRHSIDLLSRSEEDGFENSAAVAADALLKEGSWLRVVDNPTLHHVGSAPVFSSQIFSLENNQDIAEMMMTGSGKIHLDISLTSCSRCLKCSSILYDEEIMEGWSPDHSDLNTRCVFCNEKFVPLLTVTIKDLRPETKMVESPSENPPQTASLGEKGSSINRSIDSGNEAFILFEDSPDSRSLASCSHPSSPVGSPQKQSSNLLSTSPIACTASSQVNEPKEWGSIGSLPEDVPRSLGSSGIDINQTLMSEPLTVPYLSPLVLRKEVENVLDHEGDATLTKPEFVDQHPIIFWNLIWFFHRLNVPSHLPSLCLQAASINKDNKYKEWVGDNRNVAIHCMWDNPKFHEELGQPMYSLWNSPAPQSPLVHALITEERKASRNVMKQILSAIQVNDLTTPITLLINERSKWKMQRKRHHSMYRELLFLAIVAIGRENLDQMAFDREYMRARDTLSAPQMANLNIIDKPPTIGSIFCRCYFKSLALVRSD